MMETAKERILYEKLRETTQKSWPKVAQAERNRCDSNNNLKHLLLFPGLCRFVPFGNMPMGLDPTAPPGSNFLIFLSSRLFFWQSGPEKFVGTVFVGSGWVLADPPNLLPKSSEREIADEIFF